ncbi:RTA1 domain protein [Penicillium riverlandense]|uniref:RTA1 domain protein n=1 Tax=Penicillium riverlandense TaxID=1903569 RepID=UPI002546AA14|nr:RTA1 domain protein [Penicillium riverlandense]KAJ5818502.1 RTA1 domain protein [Penicillium riverlandense]
MVNKHDITLGCHALIPGYNNEYGYVPSQGAGIAFLVLFGVSLILHTVQFCWKRTWWCSVFAVGCITELIGWGGRTWSSSCPYNGTAFLMQISTLIIAPVFFTAGIYILLGRFIQLLGRDSSVLSPKWYLWIFVTCDVISLVVQAIGGGMASSAVGGNGSTATGTHIMVAGIIFQLVSITVFVFFAADFVRRTIRHHMLQSLTRSVVPLLAATVISLLCIYARSIYRTIELLQGWSGYLITHEKYFVALDGAMMVVAVGIFNVLHPGWLLPDSGTASTIKSEVSSDGVEMYVSDRA